ncbi:MAG: IPTL-CTERM sorting domain-containing protein, partial [Proteobacteria bacterium]|nr:IPTL-CTERM sorting domain-containing protein [Pseudomonadota bacterium]
FVGWTGTGCTVPDAAEPLKLAADMTANRTCTATFTLVPRDLTVVVVGGGSVSETSPGNQIDDCRAATGDCTGTYSHGTTVTLVATPDANWTFTGWSSTTGLIGCTGNNPTITVTMDADHTCVATFMLEPRYLNVTVNGQGSVSETLPGDQIDSCRAGGAGDCNGTYEHDTIVTLEATPDAYHVVTWGGACAAAGNSLTATVTMDADKTCTATFADRGYREIIVTKEVDDVTSNGYNIGGASSGRFNITVTCGGVPHLLQLADGEDNAASPIQVSVNAHCTVVEAVPADVINAGYTNFAAISPSNFIAAGDQEVLVTNRIEGGAPAKAMIEVTKFVTGELNAHDPEEPFIITVACGNDPLNMRIEHLELKGGQSGTVEGVVGERCVIDEAYIPPTRDPANYQYVWAIWPMETTLRAGEIIEVTVDNKVVPLDPRGFNTVTLRNEVSGSNPTAFDPNGRFVLELNCGAHYTWMTGPMRVGETAGYSVPDGISCTASVVSRPNPISGYRWSGETYSLGKTFTTRARGTDDNEIVTHSLQRMDANVPIPTLDPKALLLLIGLLSGFAFWQQRRQRRHWQG